MKYHDEEWSRPTHDDQVHFEFLILETFQIGLNWDLILKKRAAFREAFANFQPERVAGFTEDTIHRLLKDQAIIRNERKIRAAVENAQKFIEIQEHYGTFDAYLWGFVDNLPIINRFQTEAEVPAHTPLSKTLSKDLKSRGFKLVGPTVIYSHMQAVGLVSDHLVTCPFHPDHL